MKGVYMGAIIFTAMVSLFIGCGTGDHAAAPDNAFDENGSIVLAEVTADDVNSQSTGPGPRYIDSLPDGTMIKVYDAVLLNDTITVDFDYQVPGKAAVRRTVKVEENLGSIMVYTTSGQPLTGYTVTRQENGRFASALLTGDVMIGIETTWSGDGPIELNIIRGGESEDISFADITEYQTAADLYNRVHVLGYDKNLLTPQERDILERIEKVELLIGAFDGIGAADDIGVAQHLGTDKKFRKWVGAHTDEDAAAPASEIKDILKAACTIVRILEKICDIIGNPPICRWVEVLKEICDLIASLIK